MTAIAIARAATAHIGQPNAIRRARICWTAYRSIGAGHVTALAAAIRAFC